MCDNGQPVEVRTNLLKDGEIDQIQRNYDFGFEPGVSIPETAIVKL